MNLTFLGAFYPLPTKLLRAIYPLLSFCLRLLFLFSLHLPIFIFEAFKFQHQDHSSSITLVFQLLSPSQLFIHQLISTDLPFLLPVMPCLFPILLSLVLYQLVFLVLPFLFQHSDLLAFGSLQLLFRSAFKSLHCSWKLSMRCHEPLLLPRHAGEQ